MLVMFRDTDDLFRFRVEGDGGRVLVTSEAYPSWAEAWQGVKDLKYVINSKTWFRGDGAGTGTGTLDNGQHIHFETYKEVETNE